EWRRLFVLLGVRATVANPRVGVQRRVTEEVVRASVKVAGSALGHETDLTVRRTTVLGRIGGGQNLDLLDGVDVEHAQRRRARARAHRVDAVNRDRIAAAIAAVDVEGRGSD